MKHQLTFTEDRELTLDSYVLHVNTQVCVTCGSCERYSTLFECWLHPRKRGLSKLSRVDGQVLKRLPLAHVNLPQKSIPLCTRCAASQRADSPPTPPVSLAEWNETLKRKYAPEPATPPVKVAAPRTLKAIPNLEDL